MTREFNFQKGMNDAVDPLRLDDSTASLIENMIPDGQGNLVPVPALAAMSGIFASNIKQIKPWKAINKYLYDGINLSYDSNYYIVLKGDSKLYLFYRNTAGTWCEYCLWTSALSVTGFRYASDSTQFIFVDGKGNTRSKRITIDIDGVLTVSGLGMEGGGLIGTVNNVNMTSDINVLGGLDIPAGVFLQVIHADVNEFGDVGNPYPIIMVNANGLYRGSLDIDGKYVHDGIPSGKEISVQVVLPVGDTAVKKYVYFRWCAYSEGIMPFGPFYLAGTYTVPKSSTEMTITIANPASTIEADYENDQGGSANDVIIVNQIVVLANASSETIAPVTVDKTWRIKIQNKNSVNYVGELYKIDLVDDGYAPITDATNFLDDIDWDTDNIDNFRLLGPDRITPLRFYYYDLNEDYQYHKTPADGVAGVSVIETVKTRRLVIVEIPYMPMNMETVIYLVKKTAGFANTDWENYAGVHIESDNLEIGTRDFWKMVRCKNENTMIVYKGDPYYTETIQNLASGMFVPDNPLTTSFRGVYYYDPCLDHTKHSLIHDFPYWLRPDSSDDSTACQWITESIKMTPSGNISFWYHTLSSFATNRSRFAILEIGYAAGHKKIAIVNTIWSLPEKSISFAMAAIDGDDVTDTSFDSLVFGDDQDSNSVHSWDFFINFSWNSVKTGQGQEDGYTDVCLTIIGRYDSTSRTSKYVAQSGTYRFDGVVFINQTESDGPFVVCLRENFNNVLMETNKWIKQNTSYWFPSILNVMEGRHSFDIEPMGISSTEADMKTNSFSQACVANKNVTFELLEEQEQNAEGIIRWGVNEIPELSEEKLGEKIIRIGYIMTETGTGYQVSVFAFSEMGNVYLITISPDNQSYQNLVYLYNWGLKNADAIAIFEDSIVYLSADNTLVQITKDGFSPIRERIKKIPFNRISWNTESKSLFFINSQLSEFGQDNISMLYTQGPLTDS